MERVIKFKAKCLDNGEWVEGNLLHTETLTFITWFENGFRRLEKVDPSTICQFTGLEDENGNSIWEHDILENLPMTNEVVFNNGSFMIIEDYDDDIVEIPLSNCILYDNICYLKVIGNKFDRKEGEK